MSPSDNQLIVSGDPSSEYNVEFRTLEDDAWYSARAVLERGQALRIKFLNFDDNHDSVFEADGFKSLTELEVFRSRFRPASQQLQDHECRSIVREMTVCACYWYSKEDVRFYDAIVDAVQENEHSFHEGEEVCLCTFSLYWLHGPRVGTFHNSVVADVCKIQPLSDLDPVVALFLNMARERIEVTPPNSLSNSKGDVLFLEYFLKSYLPLCRKLAVPGGLSANHLHLKLDSKKIVELIDRRQEDRDLGGMKTQYMILIGNMDKMLSPRRIEEFLGRQTSLPPTVYIFPSLSSEIFTRGAICLDCERDFQELCIFLDNPHHIITSSTGRPWVIIEKLVGLENIKESIGTLMPLSKNQNTLQKESSGKCNDLRIAYSGTEEFKVASKLRGLFMEFSAHQERLHKRLAFEEGMASI
ncbi:putative SAWADEE domain-containing protein [Senna tora]|uniref:Putative SAWADEE domain-containing protein n=1 Tax=Senna tora TaxID=362788 RepID=A0A834WJ93_9FABA|nr:putative SAWADEE domain-containing protein [Senna tora]